MRDQLISEETIRNRYKRSMMNFTSSRDAGDSLFMRNCVLQSLWSGKTTEVQTLQSRIRKQEGVQNKEANSLLRGCLEPRSDSHFDYVSGRVDRLARELREESRQRLGPATTSS